MRSILAVLVVSLAGTGAASASSVVVAGPAAPDAMHSVIVYEGSAPSIDVIGSAVAPSLPQPAQPGEIVTVSPSIVAQGEPEVVDQTVASIGAKKPKSNPHRQTMVIRAGVIGEAFSQPSAPPAQQTAAQPQPAGGMPEQAGGEPATPQPPAPEINIKPE